MLETGLRENEEEELAADDGWSRPLPVLMALVRFVYNPHSTGPVAQHQFH